MLLGFMKDSDGADIMVALLLLDTSSESFPAGSYLSARLIFHDTGPIKCKLRSNWNFGVWLDRDSQDAMHILGTRHGMVLERCVKRTIPSERYDQQLFRQMKGRAYDIKWDKVFESSLLALLTPGTSSSSSSAAPIASSGLAMVTIPATSADLRGKEDTEHMDAEQQNAERRQDETGA